MGALLPPPSNPRSYLLSINKNLACLLPVCSRSSFFDRCEQEPRFQYYLSGITCGRARPPHRASQMPAAQLSVKEARSSSLVAETSSQEALAQEGLLSTLPSILQ